MQLPPQTSATHTSSPDPLFTFAPATHRAGSEGVQSPRTPGSPATFRGRGGARVGPSRLSGAGGKSSAHLPGGRRGKDLLEHSGLNPQGTLN